MFIDRSKYKSYNLILSDMLFGNCMSIVKRLILITVFFNGVFLSGAIFSKNIDFSVKLKSIEKIKTKERGGDELYISVTEFPKEGTPSHYQIPAFPSHWSSSYLHNIKDLTLWNKDLESCTDVKVVFSLIEEDIAPWNIDDLLGSAVLDLKCDKGEMISSWSIPNNANTKQVEKKSGAFKFEGKGASYQLNFQLERK